MHYEVERKPDRLIMMMVFGKDETYLCSYLSAFAEMPTSYLRNYLSFFLPSANAHMFFITIKITE